MKGACWTLTQNAEHRQNVWEMLWRWVCTDNSLVSLPVFDTSSVETTSKHSNALKSGNEKKHMSCTVLMFSLSNVR